MDFWIIFYTVATVQGLFVSIVLFFLKRGNKTANRILSVLVFLLSLYLLNNTLTFLKFFDNNPHFLHIVTPLWVLFAPLAYFYIQYQTKSEIKFSWKTLLHLIPFLMMLYRFLPFYFYTSEVKLLYFKGILKPSGGLLVVIMFRLLASTQLLCYSALILFKSLRENVETSIHPAHISWLKNISWIFFIFSVIEFALCINWVVNRQIIIPFRLLPLASFSVVFYSIAYLAIVQPESIFTLNGFRKKQGSWQNLKIYAQKLIEIMENEKPYLKAELKYSELASRLEISARILTETLRIEIGQSFYDFVNAYRVKEVKEMIDNNQMQRMTLLAISMEAGFNSKSSFNRIFKKHTGLSPSEYIQRLGVTEKS